MITSSNISTVEKQLKDYSKEIKNKLSKMVIGFAGEVAKAAYDNTPTGSDDMFIEGSKYRYLYLSRQKAHGIPVEPGYHAGSWQYGDHPVFSANILSKNEMFNNIYSDAAIEYKLGETFTISSFSPAIEKLEFGFSNKSPEGIGSPTLKQIMRTNELNLKNYYEGA